MQAIDWYRKAAEQGEPDAQHTLGVAYEYGRGVQQDFAQAYVWYNLAASRFPPGPEHDIAVKDRDERARRLTHAQLASAQAQTRTWQPKPEIPRTVSPPPPAVSRSTMPEMLLPVAAPALPP